MLLRIPPQSWAAIGLPDSPAPSSSRRSVTTTAGSANTGAGNMSRKPLPLDCRSTPFDLPCSSCGQYARACELLAGRDHICCERCSHPDTLDFWRVQLVVALECRAAIPYLFGLIEQFECLAQHVGWETARARWLAWRAAKERPS